jgi:flagellar hook-associated protein 3 FlgL
MERISTFSQNARTLAYVTQSQNRVSELQNQIASGVKSLDYTGVSRSAERLVTLEASHARVSQYMEDNSLVERRLNTMELNVSQIFDLMTEYKTVIVNGLNASNASDLDLKNRAQQILNQVAALLNVEEDGRKLFAGSRTNTQPVSLSALPATEYTIPTTEGASASYFVGNTDKFKVRADDNFDLTYNIDASERGFERSIRALDIMVKAPLTTDRATLDEVLGVVNNAINDLADIRTGIGGTRKTLTEVNQRHRDFILFTEQSISEIQNVDIADAVTRMTSAQTTLEASFMTIARLSQVTLMNFLR